MKILTVIALAIFFHAVALSVGFILNPFYIVIHAFCVGAIGAKLYGHPICDEERILKDQLGG